MTDIASLENLCAARAMRMTEPRPAIKLRDEKIETTQQATARPLDYRFVDPRPELSAIPFDRADDGKGAP